MIAFFILPTAGLGTWASAVKPKFGENKFDYYYPDNKNKS